MNDGIRILIPAAIAAIGIGFGTAAQRHRAEPWQLHVGPYWGKRKEFTERGWRYRNLDVLFFFLAVTAVFWVGATLGS